MMTEVFNDMPLIERQKFIGKLTHAVQNDDELYQLARHIVQIGQITGMFDGVTIMPENSLLNQSVDNITTL